MKQSRHTGSICKEIQSRLDVDNLSTESHGQTKSLVNLPRFSHEKLEKKLVRNSRTMPDKIAPEAHLNIKKGYGLWKGYLKSILVKPNVQAIKMLFLVKARMLVHQRSM